MLILVTPTWNLSKFLQVVTGLCIGECWYDPIKCRGGCVFVENAENINISYNIFKNNGNNNIFFANHVTHSLISYNEFAYGSDSGIIFLGSTNLMDGTQETHPHDNTISNNLFRELGLYNKQSSPFMQSKTAVFFIS